MEEIGVRGGVSGRVSATEPPAGESVRVGTEVRLYVQSGRNEELPLVPELIGFARDEAVLMLFSRGFTVGSVTEEFSAAPTGTVIRQSPAGGCPLPPGASVHLVISSGVPEAEKPAENQQE